MVSHYSQQMPMFQQSPITIGESLDNICSKDLYPFHFEKFDLIDLMRKISLSFIQRIDTPPSPLNLEIPSFTTQAGDFKEGWGEICTCIDIAIPEDSIYRKLLACIPIMGIIPTVINERSLRKKITQTKDVTSLVKLISIKNHYKISSIIRESLSFALVASVALKILGAATGIGMIMASGIIVGNCIALYAYGIYKNKQQINELQAHGLPSSDIQIK